MKEPIGTSERLGPGAYVALALVVLFFSGVFKNCGNFLAFFDFSTLVGAFGSIVTEQGSASFTGSGGSGAKDGFLFGLSLVPPAMLAMASIAIAEYYGALEAARRLLTPILKPLLGIPGVAGLTLVASLQNVDAGGGMTRDLHKNGEITNRQRSIFASFQLTGGACIVNFFGTGAALFMLTNADGTPAIAVSMIVPFAVILVFKVLAANIMRLYLAVCDRMEKKGAAS